LGSIAFVAGLFMAFHAFQSKGWKTFFIRTLFGALYIALGFFVWVSPVVALQGLTNWIVALLLNTGAIHLISAIQHWLLGNAFWSALSGELSIV